MPKVTFSPPSDGLTEKDALIQPTGTLIIDDQRRVFMVIKTPGGGSARFMRLGVPAGYYDVEVTPPLRLYAGTVTLENGDDDLPF